MDVPYLDCRDIRHRWVKEYYFNTESRGIVGRLLRCDECDAGRVDFIARRSGQTIGRRYLYPKDYVVKGQGRIPLDTVRRLAVRAAEVISIDADHRPARVPKKRAADERETKAS